MTAKQERFTELYKENNQEMTQEMLNLFQEILAEDFNGDSDLMDNFIRSLKPEETAISLEDLQAAMVELTNMILGG